jgi:ERCC4-related helicase
MNVSIKIIFSYVVRKDIWIFLVGFSNIIASFISDGCMSAPRVICRNSLSKRWFLLFLYLMYVGLLQVKFVYEIFKKLRPGIPLKCMHGRMKYQVQQAIVAEFNESTSVLFSTDIFARGLDIGDVDWVVQVYLCLRN